MKKILFLAAVTALTLVSCAKNEVLADMSDSNAIGFSTYVGSSPVSKSVDMTIERLSYWKSYGFHVLAYRLPAEQSWGAGTMGQASPFMSALVKNASHQGFGDPPIWTYEPQRYWPEKDNKVTFIAWAPEEIAPNRNVTTWTFDLKQAKDEMIDFIWAIDPDRFKGDKPDNPQVNLIFEHRMSKIDFTAVTDEDYNAAGTVVTLKSIKIGGIEPSGTIDLLTGTVTAVDGTDVEYTWTADESELDKTPLGVRPQGTDPLPSIIRENIDKNTKMVTSDKLIVCPQPAKALPVTVVYTTKTGENEVEVTHIVETSTPSIALEANTIYTFNLLVSLSKINITADVNAWPEHESNSVTIL